MTFVTAFDRQAGRQKDRHAAACIQTHRLADIQKDSYAYRQIDWQTDRKIVTHTDK